MQRTEQCFRALHQRVLVLEERQTWRGPTDEQVERVLRKILAEKFSEGTSHFQNPNAMKEGDYFVQDPKIPATPRPVAIDPAALIVEPDAVPSKAYAETFRMLDHQLVDYPGIEMSSTMN